MPNTKVSPRAMARLLGAANVQVGALLIPLLLALASCTSPSSNLADLTSDLGQDSSLFNDVVVPDGQLGDQDSPGDGTQTDLSSDGQDPDDQTGPKDTMVPDDFQGLLDLPDPDVNPPQDAVEAEAWQPLDTTPALCSPNQNWILEYEELPALKAMGAIATFTQNKAGTLATVPNPAGKYDAVCDCLKWDFSAVNPADEEVYDSVLPLASFWFGQYYPDADFVQFFGNDSLGIYSLDSTGLYLHGLASIEEDVTRLVYEEPIPLVKLPMKLGDNWSSEEVPAQGLYEGDEYPLVTPVTGTLSVEHSFYFAVDKKGLVKTVSGEFPVLRLTVDITMKVLNSLMPNPVAVQRFKLNLYMTECTGLVARIRSEEGELETDFTGATEYRRWGGMP